MTGIRRRRLKAEAARLFAYKVELLNLDEGVHEARDDAEVLVVRQEFKKLTRQASAHADARIYKLERR